MVGRAEWDLQNTLWNRSERNYDEQAEHDETVMDDWSTVIITDTSDNSSNNVREYSIRVNDTYTISDLVEVNDETRFQQQIKFKDGDRLNWMNMHVHYDG